MYINLANLTSPIEDRDIKYPWYKLMDPIFTTIPSMNAKTSSSAPGQSLSEQAQRTFMSKASTAVSCDDEEYEQPPGAELYGEDGGTQRHKLSTSVSVKRFLRFPCS